MSREISKLVGKVDKLACLISKQSNSDRVPFHEVIQEGAIKEYSGFKSITFTVYEGEADVDIQGDMVTFPLRGENATISGASWSSEQLSGNTLRIVSRGKIYINVIK